MTLGRWCLKAGPRHAGWIAASAVVTAALAVVSGRAQIAPKIIADNAYVFLAADRLYEGFGLTAPPPRVPSEPWEWRCDWAFLTRWPMGVPLMLCAVRTLLGVKTAQAAVALSVLSCGVALIGWFALIRRCQPKRWPALLIAALAAAGTFRVSNLVNPSSDTILLAMVPLVLLLAWPALGWSRGTKNAGSEPRGPRGRRPPALTQHEARWGPLVLLGFSTGVLVWIRYAGVFLPIGVGLFLVSEWMLRRVRFRHVAVFAAASLVPVVTLAAINRHLNHSQPVYGQYPLYESPSLNPDLGMLATAWRRFTAQTFYNHRPESAWVFAVVVPLGGLLAPLAFRDSRRALRVFFASPPVRLCAVTATTCLVMLVGLSALFGARFDYVGLERYYTPIKPFYFLFFVAPALTFRTWSLRGLATVPLVMACSWTVNQDWPRDYRRILAQQNGITSYGRRAVNFEPNSAALYQWLQTRKSDDLLVLSNFHDDIALETWIPACPTPKSVTKLNEWIERVKQARGVDDVRVLFVLDPDNHGRRYFLPPPAELVDRFDLIRAAGVPRAVAPYVYTFRTARSATHGPKTAPPHEV